MGFIDLNSTPRPADYVRCYHSARQGIYGDDNVTAGLFRVWLGYANGSIRDTFSSSDGTLAGRIPEVSTVTSGTIMAWNSFPDQAWAITSGKARCTNPQFSSQICLQVGSLGIGRTDVDVSVDVSATVGAGLGVRSGSASEQNVIYLDIPSGRVKAATIITGQMTNIFTGSIPITSGVTYTLRVTAVGSLYTVFVNGVQDGTFTTSAHASASTHGLYCFSDTAARYDNFVIAKISNPAATTYTIRNYGSFDEPGKVIKTGSVTTDFIDVADADLTVDGVSGHKYGWYKMYLTGAAHSAPWGTAYGDCTFIRVPPYSGFPSNGPVSDPITVQGSDEIARGVMAMGINRYAVDNAAADPASWIAALQPAVAKMKTWWVDNADAVRSRKTLVAFPYESGSNASNITTIVNALKTYVKAWSGRNEPNYFESASAFVTELAAISAAVKAADATATVLAPGQVSIAPYASHVNGLGFFTDFLQAGGDAYCDAYDIHPYNSYNGDLQSMRFTLGALKDTIAANGNVNKDIYQTEQGFGHAYAGQYTPSYAARWTALMVFAQEVITMGRMRSENNFYWYDTRIGFDQFPMWWLDVGGPGPQPCAVRTQSAETRSKTITSELDFGHTGQMLYCGGVWTNSTTGDKTIGVIAASAGANDIRFAVTGSATFTRVDSWGNQTTLTAVGGYVTFPVSELGCWLRVPNGTTAALVPADWSWGTNFCLAGTPFTNAPAPENYASTYANLSAMNNDEYESWYTRGGSRVGAGGNPLNNPFVHLDQNTYPMRDGVTFASTTINRIVVVCTAPWHDFGTILDFDLQTFDGTTWTTRQTWNNTSRYTWVQFAGIDRCTSEIFWPDQWIFEHKASSPITCQGVRVNVRTNSHGGFPNLTIQQANDNGQGGSAYWLDIREIQAFNTTIPAGDTTPPTKPTGLVATPVTSTRIDLSWNAATDNVGVTGYRIYRNGLLMGTSATTTYIDTNNIAGSTQYTYTVVALDAVGNPSVASDGATVTSLPEEVPPSIPTGVVATTISPNRIDIAWNASTDNVAVVGYKVFRDGVLITTTPNVFATDPGPFVVNSTYVYTVAAYDAVGNQSAPSSGATAWTFIQIGTAVGLTFSDTQVVSGVYRYTVTALDAAGNESVFADLVSASGGPASAPSSGHVRRWRRG